MFALIGLGYIVVNFHRLCPAVVALDLMKDLKVDGSIIGVLASAYFYPYAFMQIPCGLLADSWGPRKTITSFFLLAGVASLAFGFVQSAGTAIAARILVGIGVAMYFVPIMIVLTHWCTVAEFSFTTGLLLAAGGVGVLTASAPLGYLSSALGWRWSFSIVGGATLFLAAAIWIFVRNTPGELGYSLPTKENRPVVIERPDSHLWESICFVAKSPHFWPLALWYFSTLAIFYSFGGLWGGPFLMEIYHLNKPEAGAVLSMLAAAIVVGSPFFSFLSERVFHSRRIVLIISSICMLLLTLPLAFFTGKFSVLFLYLWCFALGLFGCGISSVGFTAAKESFPKPIAGTAMGMVNVFPFLGGGLMQPLIGYVLDRHGKDASGYPLEAYSHAFILYILCACVALFGAWNVKETFHSRAH